MLFQERPRARPCGLAVEEPAQIDRRVLTAQLRRTRVLKRAIDERGIPKIGDRIQVAIVFVGRGHAVCRGHQRVIELRVAMLGCDADDGVRHRGIERAATAERAIQRGA